jgi:NADH dehydrogenase
MILVVGATGLVGGQVCTRLAASGVSSRALVRATSSPEKVAGLRAQGVDVVEADLRDTASLDAACAGVDAVICTVSSMPFSYEPGVNDIQTTDLDGVRNLIDAAGRAGVGHFIYTSFSANLDLDFPLGRAKRAVETHLMRSGLAYTILRPSCFMEVWLSPAVGFDPGNGTVTIYGEGTRPVSYIATADVAAFAVASLTAPAARNAVLELGGPEALSQIEAKEVFEEVLGRPVATQSVPVEALQGQLAAASDPMQQSFAGLMLCVAKGDPIDMRSLLPQFPVQLTTVKAFATG